MHLFIIIKTNFWLYWFYSFNIFLYKSLGKYIKNYNISNKNLFNIFINILGICLVTYNILSTYDYSIENLSIFAGDGGSFFGYPRDLLRIKLNLQNESIFCKY